jgi:acetyl esterase/lipase
MNKQSIVKLPTTTKQELEFRSQTYLSKVSGDVHLDNISEPELEVFLADPSSNTRKAIIIAPGGALFFHAIEHEGTTVAQRLASNGINAFVLKYRLYPVDGNAEDYVNELVAKEDWEGIHKCAVDTLPFALEDAIQALKHLRVNCESYSIDSKQIGMIGFSAGGALTLETLFQGPNESRPNYIGLVYPWVDIISKYDFPNENTPAFFSCASDDALLLAPKTVDLYQKWIQMNYTAELHMHESGGHGYGTKNIPEVSKWFELLIDWIERR